MFQIFQFSILPFPGSMSFFCLAYASKADAGESHFVTFTSPLHIIDNSQTFNCNIGVSLMRCFLLYLALM